MRSGIVAPVPMTGALVMARALDPYHRIRAAVGAIFLLSVLIMAVATMHGPVRRPTVSQGGAVSGQAVSAVPATGSAVPALLVAPVAPVSTAAAVSGAGRVAGSAAAAHPRTSRAARTH